MFFEAKNKNIFIKTNLLLFVLNFAMNNLFN